MTPTAPIVLARHQTLIPVRQELLDVYAEVRAGLLHLPNYSVARFAQRLDRDAAEPGWEAVIAYAETEPVGFAYLNRLTADDHWWSRLQDPLPDGFAAVPTVALKDIGVRTAWRTTGTARRIHDEILTGRTEHRATVLVNPKVGDGKIQALYASWGYQVFNRQQSSPNSPALVAMMKELQPAG